MAHFAEIGLNNIVLRTIVINNEVLLDENGIEQESLGAEFCRETFGGTWVQTSYNRNFRVYFGNKGMIYNSTADRFELPQPYPSWTWNENAVCWQAPIVKPDDTDESYFEWDENSLSWQEVSLSVEEVSLSVEEVSLSVEEEPEYISAISGSSA